MIAAKSDLSAYSNDCLSVRNDGFTSGTGALHDISDGGESLFSLICNLDRIRSVAGTGETSDNSKACDRDTKLSKNTTDCTFLYNRKYLIAER